MKRARTLLRTGKNRDAFDSHLTLEQAPYQKYKASKVENMPVLLMFSVLAENAGKAVPTKVCGSFSHVHNDVAVGWRRLRVPGGR